MKKSKANIIAQQEEAISEGKPKSKVRLAVNIIVDVILVLAILMAILATYTSFVSHSGSGVANIFGYTPFSVQTESMYPTFEPGDLIFSKKASSEELRKLEISEYDEDGNLIKAGDIITYWTNINGQQVLNTHRVVGIYDAGDHIIFETKGDGNTMVDSLTVHEAYVVGVYTGTKWSGMGKVFDFLQTSTGFLVCVVLPIALFFIFNLVQFFRSLFEYQNVKTLIKYEESLDEEGANPQNGSVDEETKKRMEQELRERIKAEMLAEMQKNNADELNTVPQTDSQSDK